LMQETAAEDGAAAKATKEGSGSDD
jgi:hypothetical protein